MKSAHYFLNSAWFFPQLRPLVVAAIVPIAFKLHFPAGRLILFWLERNCENCQPFVHACIPALIKPNQHLPLRPASVTEMCPMTRRTRQWMGFYFPTVLRGNIYALKIMSTIECKRLDLWMYCILYYNVLYTKGLEWETAPANFNVFPIKYWVYSRLLLWSTEG